MGKDLVEYFSHIYGKNAKHCVMCISSSYKDKIWTTHERRSALCRALELKSDYILPLRFDDTEIDGLLPSVAFIPATEKTPEEVAAITLKKLGKS